MSNIKCPNCGIYSKIDLYSNDIEYCCCKNCYEDSVEQRRRTNEQTNTNKMP